MIAETSTATPANARYRDEFCPVKEKVNPNYERTAFMNNRVLSRMGARELKKEEVDAVIGAGCNPHNPCTLTLCTIDSTGAKDGDVSLGEC